MENDYLTEKEEVLVKQFVGNQPMMDAVKKVLLAHIYSQGTIEKGKIANSNNFAFLIVENRNTGESKTDEQIGQELRAAVSALNYLKTGFDRLKEFVTPPPKPDKNPTPGR